MAEFIGARISLISKRDIRYVGTLHQINSDDSTVALEQVVSYGTEGRRPDDEVPPSLDNIYEYIVFRGSDVKDLRIEEQPQKQSEQKPKVPDDPAILGSTRKPATPSGRSSSGPNSQAPAPGAQQPQQAQQHGGPPGQGPPGQGPPGQGPPNQHQQFPPHMQGPNFPYFPPPNQRFGPQGFPPPGPGFPPGMPYGGPPGWYPPYNNNFPHMPPGQFPPHQMPIGPPGQGRGQPHGNQGPGAPGGPGGPGGPGPQSGAEKGAMKQGPGATKVGSQSNTPVPLQEAPSAPPPPTDSKPDVAAALAPATNNDTKKAGAPTGPRSGRVVPAVPRPAVPGKSPSSGQAKVSTDSGITAPNLTKSLEDANRDARAAVAAAMAKLPAGQAQENKDGAAVDNLTRKIGELRTNDPMRGGRGGAPGPGRGRGRGGGGPRRVEVPKTDYDFESANAKFNKQDLVKEAIATGSPVHTPGEEEAVAAEGSNGVANGRKSSETVIIPAQTSYNRNNSFFDDISSEIKDRADGQDGQKLGREFRSEERQKNMETFGQGSVDYRYGRGRGRGRGRGFRGRGRGGRGRGGIEN